MRLIDADALKSLLIETLENIAKKPAMDGQEMHIIAGCHMLCEMIDDAEPVDADPVRHGEWDVTVCTRCGHDLSGWADGAYEAVADGDVHFCPKCGAKMDGGEE